MTKNKGVLTPTSSSNAVETTKCELAVKGHEHLHAANCGHKSYVHAGHVCYEHEGHYHYMHDGHAHDCAGPFVQQAARPVKTTGTPAKVISLDKARNNRKKQ